VSFEVSEGAGVAAGSSLHGQRNNAKTIRPSRSRGLIVAYLRVSRTSAWLMNRLPGSLPHHHRLDVPDGVPAEELTLKWCCGTITILGLC
jgi:hypothetical protein